MSQPTVFISYSHKDEAEKDTLLTHLGVLQNAGLVDLWNDDRIPAGGDWEQEIEQAMAQAKVAILLISANFLTSKFILGKEVPQLLERREKEGLVIFPVIAKACAWQEVKWLAKMNVRPKNGKPVWREGGVHVDEELTVIAREVAKLTAKAETSKTTPDKKEKRADNQEDDGKTEKSYAPVTPSWIVAYGNVPSTPHDDDISRILKGYDPFPEAFAEHEFAFLFGDMGGFWSGHPVYHAISSNFLPQVIISEPGLGRTAFARALVQVGDADGNPLVHTLPIFIADRKADWPGIKSEIAKALLDFASVNLPHFSALHSEEQRFLVHFLVGNLGENRVRARLLQAFPAMSQQPASSAQNDDEWLQDIRECLRLLKFERIVLAIDFKPKDNASLDTILEHIQQWRDHNIIAKLFLPDSPTRRKYGLQIRRLTWNNDDLTQMAEWRFESLARLTDTRLTLDMLFEGDLYPQFIQRARRSPRRLAQLWRALFEDHLEHSPERRVFSEANLERAVEQVEQAVEQVEQVEQAP